MENRIYNLKKEYDNIPVPPVALDRINAGIDKAKKEKEAAKKIVKFPTLKRVGLGAAAALALCFIGVNSSSNIAKAAGDLPLIGKFFEVITIRTYETENISASLPEITEKDSTAATLVNKESSKYIEGLIEKFTEETKDLGLSLSSLDVNYTVLTDSDFYFALKITGTETAAGGYEFSKIYTIDKAKDKVLSLSDLFDKDFDYVSVISDEIIKQMEEDIETPYFLGEENDGFTKIRPDQNFYINEDNDLIICFDEYEVGPGSIGSPSFLIPKEVLK